MNSGDTITRPSHLFVYGTLLSVAEHPMGDLLRQSAQPVGEGYIQACLYIIEEIDAQGLNCFPGAVPSARPHDRVFGALYNVHSPEPMYTNLTPMKLVQRAIQNRTNFSYAQSMCIWKRTNRSSARPVTSTLGTSQRPLSFPLDATQNAPLM